MDSVLGQAQNGDADDPFTQALRGRYNDLHTQKNNALDTATDQDNPPAPGNVDLHIALDGYDQDTLTITITLPGDGIPAVTAAASHITA